MTILFNDLQAQYQSIKPEIDAAIQNILTTSHYVQGPAVARFENHFAEYCGTQHCIAVNSGTSALSLLLRAYGIGEGDEVITAANTFFATVAAIIHVGAKPVLVDCQEKTALIDVEKISAKITSCTKAIVPVHLYGQPCDMKQILGIAEKHSLLVLEDACQAHGAMYQGKRAGNLAHGAAFSFYPGKNLGAYGEGGAVTTNNDDVAHTIRLLREHGSPKKYQHDIIGWNERMDGIQGAVLDAKLAHLDAWNKTRADIVKTYQDCFDDTVECIQQEPDRTSSHHLFVIRHPQRDALKIYLQNQGIDTGIHYPIPIHQQKAWRPFAAGESFPVTEKLSTQILSLPLYAEMTADQVEAVCDSVLRFAIATRGGKVATIVRNECHIY